MVTFPLLIEYDPVRLGRYKNLDNRISRRRRLTDYVARSTTDIIDNPLWIMTLHIIIRGLSEGPAGGFANLILSRKEGLL